MHVTPILPPKNIYSHVTVFHDKMQPTSPAEKQHALAGVTALRRERIANGGEVGLLESL